MGEAIKDAAAGDSNYLLDWLYSGCNVRRRQWKTTSPSEKTTNQDDINEVTSQLVVSLRYLYLSPITTLSHAVAGPAKMGEAFKDAATVDELTTR